MKVIRTCPKNRFWPAWGNSFLTSWKNVTNFLVQKAITKTFFFEEMYWFQLSMPLHYVKGPKIEFQMILCLVEIKKSSTWNRKMNAQLGAFHTKYFRYCFSAEYELKNPQEFSHMRGKMFCMLSGIWSKSLNGKL